MSNYSRANDTGNKRNFGKPRFNRDRSQMYQATCANCGKECEVPFRPTGSKPVLCRDCFQNSKNSDRRPFENRSFDRPSFSREDNRDKKDYQAQFDLLNEKMDKILNLLSSTPITTPEYDSEIDKETINEIVDEVQEEEKKTAAKKIKKEKTSKPKKSSTKKK
jgi:CxxC-x17-CxxC domain-containing protein